MNTSMSNIRGAMLIAIMALPLLSQSIALEAPVAKPIGPVISADFPFGAHRPLTEVERQAYRAPYPTPESRKPTLVWPREVPIAGEPADVLAIIDQNGAWLRETTIPKLMFYAEPGVFGGPEVAAYFAANLQNIETNYVGPGNHYIQKDHPHVIGRELADWLRRHK